MTDAPGSGPPLRPPIRSRVANSVRFRLTVIVVLVVGVSLIGGGAVLVRWVEATLVNDLRARNEAILSSMAENLRDGRLPVELFRPVTDPAQLVEDYQQLFGDPTEAEEAISTTYFYMDGPGISSVLPTTGSGPIPLASATGEVGLFQRQGPPASRRGTIEVVEEVPTPTGVIRIHAVSPADDIARSVGTLTGALWLGLPVLVFGAGMLTWFIAGSTLAPVRAMTRRVRELSASNLDARVPVPHTEDEIAELAITMNDMLERLQQSTVSQRQFVSDASHELRSPVASIRAQLETALQYPDDVDWPEVARIVLAEDARLEHLVGNLLAMARLDEGRLGPRSDVDLDEIVMAQARRMTKVDVDVAGVSAGRVWGNAGELTSVVRNLFDNAERHATSTVWATVREVGPWVVVTVSDDGPGVPPEDTERIFERFARLQEGRSRDQGGTGLGLALSRRIVDNHGGSLHVRERPGGGAQFVVSLPSAAWTGEDDDEHGDDDAGDDDAGDDDEASSPSDVAGPPGA